MIRPVIVEAGFRNYLVGDPFGNSHQDETRRQSRQMIRTMVANAVFAARRPKAAHKYGPQRGLPVELSVTLERIGGDRDYALDGEDECIRSRIVSTVYARGERAEAYARRLTEFIRLATSAFRGDWFYADDDGQTVTFSVSAATVGAERTLPPLASKELADRWHTRVATDWNIWHTQTISEPATSYYDRRQSNFT